MSDTIAKNLESFRIARKLTPKKLARLSGVSETKIQLFEQAKKTPSRSDLEKFGLVLGVPSIAFRSGRSLELPTLPLDFRTHDNKRALMSLAGAKTISDSLKKAKFVNRHTKTNREFAPEVTATLSDEPEVVGQKLRKSLHITTDGQIDVSPSQFLRVLSNSIQLKGVFVFRRSSPTADFRGFTSNLRPFPLIVVNTKDSTVAAQIFTLAHEYVHLVIDKPGVSDPRGDHHNVEKFCNRVAAAMLAPKLLFSKYVASNPHDIDQQLPFLSYISAKLKISLFATAIRLKELGFVGDEYVARYVAGTKNFDKDSQKSGGGGAVGDYDYGAGQIWRYGSRFLGEVGHLLDRGDVTFVDVEKVLGISEEKIVALIGQASIEQKAVADRLERIEFSSFSRPNEEYEFDVV